MFSQIRRLLILLCLCPMAGCVELETRPVSGPSLGSLTRRSDTQASRDFVEVAATPAVTPSPADPTLDDDDDDEDEEDAEDATHPRRRSTAR